MTTTSRQYKVVQRLQKQPAVLQRWHSDRSSMFLYTIFSLCVWMFSLSKYFYLCTSWDCSFQPYSVTSPYIISTLVFFSSCIASCRVPVENTSCFPSANPTGVRHHNWLVSRWPHEGPLRDRSCWTEAESDKASRYWTWARWEQFPRWFANRGGTARLGGIHGHKWKSSQNEDPVFWRLL